MIEFYHRWRGTALFVLVAGILLITFYTLDQKDNEQDRKNVAALKIVAAATCVSAEESRLAHIEFRNAIQALGGDASKITIPGPVNCATIAQKVIEKREE